MIPNFWYSYIKILAYAGIETSTLNLLLYQNGTRKEDLMVPKVVAKPEHKTFI